MYLQVTIISKFLTVITIINCIISSCNYHIQKSASEQVVVINFALLVFCYRGPATKIQQTNYSMLKHFHVITFGDEYHQRILLTAKISIPKVMFEDTTLTHLILPWPVPEAAPSKTESSTLLRK